MEHRAESNPYLYFFSGELAFLSFSQVFPICLDKPDMLTKLLEVSSLSDAARARFLSSLRASYAGRVLRNTRGFKTSENTLRYEQESRRGKWKHPELLVLS